VVAPTEQPSQYVDGIRSGRALADLASVWGSGVAFTDLDPGQLRRAAAALKDIFTGYGDGARGLVAVGYADGTGHVFNVENVRGRVIFPDALDGKLDARYRLKGALPASGDGKPVPVNYIGYMRTDDSNPSPGAMEAFLRLPDGVTAEQLGPPAPPAPAVDAPGQMPSAHPNPPGSSAVLQALNPPGR